MNARVFATKCLIKHDGIVEHLNSGCRRSFMKLVCEHLPVVLRNIKQNNNSGGASPLCTDVIGFGGFGIAIGITLGGGRHSNPGQKKHMVLKLPFDVAMMRTELDNWAAGSPLHDLDASYILHPTYIHTATDPIPYILLPRMSGSLAAFLKTWGGTLTVPQFAMIADCLLRGLHDMHTVARYIHRDIKPHNILCDWDAATGDLRAVRITDMGSARPIDAPPVRHGTTSCYQSPETLLQRQETPASDVFSCVLVLLECLNGGQRIIDSPASEVHTVLNLIATDVTEPIFTATNAPSCPSVWAIMKGSLGMWPGVVEALYPASNFDPARRPSADTLRANIRAATQAMRSMHLPLPISTNHPFARLKAITRAAPFPAPVPCTRKRSRRQQQHEAETVSPVAMFVALLWHPEPATSALLCEWMSVAVVPDRIRILQDLCLRMLEGKADTGQWAVRVAGMFAVEPPDLDAAAAALCLPFPIVRNKHDGTWTVLRTLAIDPAQDFLAPLIVCTPPPPSSATTAWCETVPGSGVWHRRT